MRHQVFLSAVGLFALSGCGDVPTFTAPLKLANGTEISPAQLSRGYEAYTLYCRACHGDQGDGKGPAGIGLRPPPRNFREPSFKFGGVAAGDLPPDSELKRIVKGGLAGTAMLPWELPDAQLDDVIQYIKTFSEVWTEDEPGELVEIGEDTWKGKEKEAIQRGSDVYHGLAQCTKCHPSYASKQEMWDAAKTVSGEGSTSAFREGMYYPEAKFAEAYGHKLLPPDFVRHQVKAGESVRELFRTIGSGIGGTAMPMWKGSLEDEDLWALSHYVRSLIETKDSPEWHKRREAWLNQPEFVPPEPVEGEAAEAAE